MSKSKLNLLFGLVFWTMSIVIFLSCLFLVAFNTKALLWYLGGLLLAYLWHVARRAEKEPDPSPTAADSGGFTLIELALVLVIIIALISMVLPAVQHARMQVGEELQNYRIVFYCLDAGKDEFEIREETAVVDRKMILRQLDPSKMSERFQTPEQIEDEIDLIEQGELSPLVSVQFPRRTVKGSKQGTLVQSVETVPFSERHHDLEVIPEYGISFSELRLVVTHIKGTAHITLFDLPTGCLGTVKDASIPTSTASFAGKQNHSWKVEHPRWDRSNGFTYYHPGPQQWLSSLPPEIISLANWHGIWWGIGSLLIGTTTLFMKDVLWPVVADRVQDAIRGQDADDDADKKERKPIGFHVDNDADPKREEPS